MSRPIANSAEPERERPAERAPVDGPADDRDADQRAEEERREDPAVQLHAAELAAATIGRTVETASASKATSVMVRTRPPLRTRRSGDQRPSSVGGAAGLSSGKDGGSRAIRAATAGSPRPVDASGPGESLHDRGELVDVADHERRDPEPFAEHPEPRRRARPPSPTNRCGDSRTSSSVRSTPVRPRSPSTTLAASPRGSSVSVIGQVGRVDVEDQVVEALAGGLADPLDLLGGRGQRQRAPGRSADPAGSAARGPRCRPRGRPAPASGARHHR